MRGIKLKERISAIFERAEEGLPVTVCGWVKSKRTSKKFSFIVLNDGSTQRDLQAVVDAGVSSAEQLDLVHTGTAIRIDGQLVASPGKGQSWEVQANELQVLGTVDPAGYPLQKKGHSLEFLRDVAHLRGRSNTFGAVFRVRNQLSMLVHEFFQSRGFIWAHTPIITASDCEGAGEMFQVTTLDSTQLASDGPDYQKDFFGQKAHLTVSGQLNGEALALSMGDIYTFGPTFRAENSNTTRHLSEFWMVEPEMAFADLRDNAALAEDFLRFLFEQILRRCPEELAFLSKFYPDCDPNLLSEIANRPFQKMSYSEAIRALEKSGEAFQFPVHWGCDLQTEHEKFLTEHIVGGPVIVTDYPQEIKAFYMKANGDGKTVAAMDVLVPRIGEIIGGAQREDRYDILLERVKDQGIDPSSIGWYLDLRRQGGCQHAGFGLGFERLVQYVTGMSNIRDVIPFPRAPQLINF